MASKYLAVLGLLISAKVSASTLLIPNAGRVHINGELVNSTCTVFTNNPGFYIDLQSLLNQNSVHSVQDALVPPTQFITLPFTLNVEGCADFSLENKKNSLSVLPMSGTSGFTSLSSISLVSLVINKLDFSKFDLSFLNIDELHRKLVFKISYPLSSSLVSTPYKNASFILNFNYL